MFDRPLIRFSLPGALSLSACLALVGCGGSQAEPGHSADDASEEQSGDAPSGISAQAEIGALDQDQVASTFRDSLPGLQNCLIEGSKRIEFIGGTITFLIKVNQDHRVVHVHAVDSTIGDRKTELCMFDVLKRASWPAPQGGLIGIAQNPFDFDAPVDVRAPVHWNESQISSQLSQLSSEVNSCKRGVSGRFSATLYIDTDGNPISGSVTPPDEAGEDAVDCLVGVLLGAHYDTPGSWPAKVTADL